jgi:hypothetical protein
MPTQRRYVESYVLYPRKRGKTRIWLIQMNYYQETGVSIRLSGNFRGRVFQELLGIASRMSQKLLHIATRGTNTPRSWDLLEDSKEDQCGNHEGK